MAVYGKIEEFDPNNEKWTDYADRIEQYFYANEINDEKKQTAIFLTVIGSTTYGLLKSLLAPTKVTEKTFKQLHEVLKKHLDPAVIEIAERFKFCGRIQNKGERLNYYIAELGKLAETCNFGTFLSQALRDKYACGVQDASIRKRLLIEDNLTLHTALKISHSLETAKAENTIIAKREIKEESNYKMFAGRNPRTPPRCYRCNDERHLANVCRFKDVTCNKHGSKGHISKACRGGPRKKTTEACNVVASGPLLGHEYDDDNNKVTLSSDEDFEVMYIHKLASR